MITLISFNFFPLTIMPADCALAAVYTLSATPVKKFRSSKSHFVLDQNTTERMYVVKILLGRYEMNLR